jgi:hypothetical protein
MDEAGTLQIFAEVAVALAGFTGVVAAFSRRGDAGWTPFAYFRFRVTLEAALAALLLALTPLTLHALGLPPLVLWSMSSGLFLGVVVVQMPLDAHPAREPSLLGDPDLSPAFGVMASVLLLTAAGIQLVNVLGVGVERGAGPFVAGLLALIAVCVMMFTRLLVVFRPRPLLDAKEEKP